MVESRASRRFRLAHFRWCCRLISLPDRKRYRHRLPQPRTSPGHLSPRPRPLRAIISTLPTRRLSLHACRSARPVRQIEPKRGRQKRAGTGGRRWRSTARLSACSRLLPRTTTPTATCWDGGRRCICSAGRACILLTVRDRRVSPVSHFAFSYPSPRCSSRPASRVARTSYAVGVRSGRASSPAPARPPSSMPRCSRTTT
jgi:hypothetical protein